MGLSTKGPISKWEGSWAEKMIRDRGARAFAAGISYSANPYDDPKSRLTWSQGHNDARVSAHMSEKERA
jgi:ribosome modulation factor